MIDYFLINKSVSSDYTLNSFYYKIILCKIDLNNILLKNEWWSKFQGDNTHLKWIKFADLNPL
jgi:hypothetical protein